MHTHGPNVSAFLSDVSVRMHLPDGSHVDVNKKAGFGVGLSARRPGHRAACPSARAA